MGGLVRIRWLGLWGITMMVSLLGVGGAGGRGSRASRGGREEVGRVREDREGG